MRFGRTGRARRARGVGRTALGAGVALTLVSLLTLAGCSGDSEKPESAGTSCTYRDDGQEPAEAVDLPAKTATATGDVTATIVTNVGDIVVTLDGAQAPCTVNSFLSLAKQDYFDKSPCHRLTTQGIFVLQCGDPSGTGTGGPGYSFADELTGKETYPAGTVAMANAGRPGTNGSQFFFVYADSTLPPAYTVFGELDEDSLATLADVARKGSKGGGPDGPPKKAVTIEDVSVG